MRRKISIFGSTGSIGCNTVDLISRQGGAESFEVVALTGGKNIAELAGQAKALNATYAVTADEDRTQELADLLKGSSTQALGGREALVEIAKEPVDWSMSAIVGAAGLEPTMQMAKHSRVLALANKESLVCAGDLLLQTCLAHDTELLPVDSEHSAIFQALGGYPASEVSRILLTASGGPFRTWSLEKLAKATREEALQHPNWDMGARITVDSASMFNKALEVIEAKYLFGVEPDQIEVVVHPQSIIHSMVEFNDGAIMAQLGAPDMRGPIGYALNHPDRSDLPVDRLDFKTLSRLDFEAPDEERFPSLRLAKEALSIGGGAGAVLNASKETALDAFLDGTISYLDMATCVEHVLTRLKSDAAKLVPADGLDAVISLDIKARALAEQHIEAALSQKEKVN